MWWSKKKKEAEDDATGPKTVMLVDDDYPVRRYVERALGKKGYTVILCEDGTDAVEMYKEHGSEIALVIMDMIMPEMDGKTAFFELKKIDPEVKVVVASGYSVGPSVQACIDEGALKFLNKPFQLNELLVTVEGAFSGSFGGTASPPR